jgi:hypothetical protein
LNTFEAVINTKEKTVILRKPDWDNIHANLHYSIQENYTFFTGKIGYDSVRIKAKRKKKEDYRLNKRGFHWINEYPFNK